MSVRTLPFLRQFADWNHSLDDDDPHTTTTSICHHHFADSLAAQCRPFLPWQISKRTPRSAHDQKSICALCAGRFLRPSRCCCCLSAAHARPDRSLFPANSAPDPISHWFASPDYETTAAVAIQVFLMRCSFTFYNKFIGGPNSGLHL